MQQEKIQDTSIVVCERCKGEGGIQVATGDADHCRMEACPRCGGMRVMKRVVTVEFLPVREMPEKLS